MFEEGSDNDFSDLNFTNSDEGVKLLRQAMQVISMANSSNDYHARGNMSLIETMLVHCNFVDARAMLSLRRGWFVSTTDGGADTMILGKGWYKVYVNPNRTARIIGFDKKHAQKRDCPMGTGAAVFQDRDGIEVLVVAHEAVFNEGCTTTLLSEFQMRHSGLIID